MIQLHRLYDDQGSIVRFVGEDLDTGNAVIVAADHRPAQGIIDALEAGEEVLVDPEPWAVRTLVEAGRP